MVYDVAIIGAGPAGATLARLLGNQYRVLLVDRRNLLDPPDNSRPGKCCGGLLAPDAQQMLAQFSLGLPAAVLAEPQVFAVRVLDLDNGIERYVQRHYLNCHRELFDRWLLALAPGSVEVRCGCALTSLEVNDGVEITLTSGGNRCTERARVLVGADGANSRVRRLAFPAQPRAQAYLALQEWYETDMLLPYFSAIFDREITDYYSWTIPKNGLLIVGAALAPQQEPAKRFDHLVTKIRRLGYRLGHCVRREGALVLRPTCRQIYTGEGAILLAGEAAGLISPSSAEGISYAFCSALALADSLRPGLDNAAERYSRAIVPLRRNIRLKGIKSLVIATPGLRRLVLRAGMPRLVIAPETAATATAHGK